MRYAIPFLFALSIGCASMPITQAERQTDAILGGDILKPDHVVTVADKTQIRTALKTDVAVIHQEQAAAVTAEKQAASNAVWAHRGKVGAWIGAGIGILLLLGIILGSLRRIGIIP